MDLAYLFLFLGFLAGWVAGLYTYDYSYQSVWRYQLEQLERWRKEL